MEEIIAAPKTDDVIEVHAPGVTGDLRLHQFASRIFRNTRFLRVWLPPGYDAPENSQVHYPVFYLNDGQNLFEAKIAFGGVKWGVDDTADRLIREGKIPPIIFVGIDNAQAGRLKEYLPFRSYNPPVLRPQGKRYADFLVNEVMPFMSEHYRVATGPQNTALGGSSLGALISLYAALSNPGIFGGLLIESPSLFIGRKKILRYARTGHHEWPAKMVLAVGSQESGREEFDRKVVADVRELETILRSAGLGEDRLMVNIDDGGHHSEGDWARRLPSELEFLLGSSKPS